MHHTLNDHRETCSFATHLHRHAIIAQMGFSSWNAIGSQVNAAYIKKVAQYFVDSGLQEKVRADLLATIPPAPRPQTCHSCTNTCAKQAGL
jgi:hypothetical protein